jgi:LacI family transcriptional regulator
MVTRKSVTITQVARAANVSAQTVSRVVNDRPDVAPETRILVKQVIAQLGYRPNALARSLIHQRSHTLGVVVTGLDYFGPSRTLVGIERQIRAQGYSLLLDLSHHPETENVDNILNRLLSRQVDGIIWAISEIGNNRTWLERNTRQTAVPMIFLTMESRPGLSIISIDNFMGGYLAACHLLVQGYRRIGIILGPWSWWEVRQRKRGWQKALEEYGLTIDPPQMAEGDWSAASGYKAFQELLVHYPQIDAVFACNDQMALGALQAAHLAGRRVPSDLAVVGFDDTPESPYFMPPLTTIKQPLVELGSRAVQELVKTIEAEHQSDLLIQPETIALIPELIVRESSLLVSRTNTSE